MAKVERIEGSEPQNLLNGVAGRMNWSVLWFVPKTDTIIRHRYGADLGEAVRVYSLVKRAGRVNATLRCDNIGFPPPKKWQPHYVRVPKIVEGTRGKKRRVYETQHRVPMNKANRAGIYWCPYCREMRRFQLQNGFHSEGQWCPDPDPRGGLYCPMCGISHRDFHVRRWNPIADRHYLTKKSTRRSSGSNRSNGGTRRRQRAKA